MALRAAYDTCVWVARERGRGAAFHCVEAARQRRVQLGYCSEMIAELARVLYRPPFRYRVDDVRAVLYEVRQLGTEVQLSGTLQVVEADPDDNKIVECAVVWQAEFIVSRNTHLLDLGTYEGIQIVTPQTFLALLDQAAAAE